MNEANDSIIHSFSRPLAEKYGVNSAIVVSYLGHRIKTSKNLKDGKCWFYGTIDELAANYPYLSRTAVYNGVQALTRDDGPIVA